MDSGPFRVPRSAESGKQEATEAPRAPQRQVVARQPVQEKRSKKRVIFPIGAIILVVILIIIGWSLLSGRSNTATGIDNNKYQAIFFTNGQVYFGKLQAFSDQYLKMTDIYYLQAQSSSTSEVQTTSTDQNVTLIKLGSEVHGPEDEMMISKDQVLFYENLKADSRVVQQIEKLKKS